MNRRNLQPWRPAVLGALVLALLLSAGPAGAVVCDDPTMFFTRPIPLGVSGGNAKDLTRSYCCSGTLGALVQDGNGTKYILSNNHVLALSNNGKKDTPISQPGLVDAQCSATTAEVVAQLTQFIKIRFKSPKKPNTVDAAVAQVVNDPLHPGTPAVDPQGAINCIGSISATTATPVLGLDVRKSGRTTGLTQGTIAALDVTVVVQYEKKCGSGAQLAYFVNQVRIDSASFSNAGDSGSLIVDNSNPPQPVALLFAGGNNSTFANPISEVLSAFAAAGLPLSFVGATGAGALGAEALLPGGESADLAQARKMKRRHEESLLQVPGVVGVGVGRGKDGQPPVVEIYVQKHTPELKQQLPATLDGVKVRTVETGIIRAF